MRQMTDPSAIGRAWFQAGLVGPPVDVYEVADSVIVRMAIPGAEGSTLSLTVDEDTMMVRGESPVPGSRWGDRTIVHWQEIPYGRFERRVPLPVAVRKSAARAQYKNGILEVTLPKDRPQAARTVQINIT
jgi:HSP20 family protein